MPRAKKVTETVTEELNTELVDEQPEQVEYPTIMKAPEKVKEKKETVVVRVTEKKKKGFFASLKQARRLKNGTVSMNFLDTGETVDVEKAHEKKTFRYGGQDYVINPECWFKDHCYYLSFSPEPVSLQTDAKKWKFAVTTDRFNSVYNNKVLMQLMYVKEKSLLTYILIAAAAAGLIGIVNIYYTTQIIAMLREGLQMAVEAGVVY